MYTYCYYTIYFIIFYYTSLGACLHYYVLYANKKQLLNRNNKTLIIINAYDLNGKRILYLYVYRGENAKRQNSVQYIIVIMSCAFNIITEFQMSDDNRERVLCSIQTRRALLFISNILDILFPF